MKLGVYGATSMTSDLQIDVVFLTVGMILDAYHPEFNGACSIELFRPED